MSPKISEEILNTIAPFYRPYIKQLWRDLNFGLYKTKVDIEQLRCNSNELSHQFSLILPYCGKFLKWEVIFEPTYPSNAPDFRFDDDTFLSTVDPDFLEAGAPSWHNWDATDPRSLSKVVSELMALYRAHQIKQLSEDENSRAYFEYTALLGDSITRENDLEIWVGHGRTVQFLIRLDIKTEQLPQLFQESDQNPGGECALLLVRYPNPTGAELIMSPLVTRAVGNISLPPMHQSGVLMDYVPMVTSVINKRIEEVLSNELFKRELLSQLVVKYQGAVLEQSSKDASFLFEINNFYWILTIDIAVNHPECHPQIVLRSVYHSNHRKPSVKVLPPCSYARFEEYVMKQVAIFRSECEGTPQNNSDNVLRIVNQ